jgi:hypothetical protein
LHFTFRATGILGKHGSMTGLGMSYNAAVIGSYNGFEDGDA